MTLPDTVWVGQQATYQVGVFLSDEIRGRLRRNPVFVPPELRSMLAYDLASLNSVPRYAGSRRYEVHVFQRALFPLTAGRHEIPPARLEYALPLSNSFFAREESHSARTQSLVVIAREPPMAGRPPGYPRRGWPALAADAARRPRPAHRRSVHVHGGRPRHRQCVTPSATGAFRLVGGRRAGCGARADGFVHHAGARPEGVRLDPHAGAARVVRQCLRSGTRSSIRTLSSTR